MKKMNNEILYQIVPDRFYIGKGKTIEQKSKENLYPANAVLKKWDDLPDENFEVNNQFFGGDLYGIKEKVDYLSELGITSLYITPIFSAETYHKYDATDYKSVDKAFGGDTAFDQLVQELHKKGIKIIIDIALNHVSNKHPYFIDAISNKESKYINYFKFIDYPDNYYCWWDHKYLPELNLDNPEVIEKFITGKDSVIEYWLKRGIDGIRLDCANDLGIEVTKIIKNKIKEVKPEAILIGEIFNYAPSFNEGLDSLQCYFYTESIFSLLNGTITSRQFGLNIKNLIDRHSHQDMLNNLIILSSHDSRRVLSELDNDINKMFLALVLQFTLPGVPKIFYGDEIGMTGMHDPHNRAPMIWEKNKWQTDINNFYRKLIELRKTKVEFTEGKIIELSNWLDNGVATYIRYSEEKPDNYSIVVINPTDEKKEFRLFIPYDYQFSAMVMVDYFKGKKIQEMSSYIDIEIEPMDFYILSPDKTQWKEYDYFKRVSPLKI